MKSPAFQFYPGDWLGSQRVQLMSLKEEGGYMRLLCYCWLHGSIPSEPAEIARLIGKGGSTTLATTLATMFQPAASNRLVHDRLEAERHKQAEWRKKSSQGGKKSAKMRRKTGAQELDNKEPDEGSLKNGINQTATLPSPSSSPSSDPDPQSSAKPLVVAGSRVRNPKFDALAAACGIDPLQMTARDARACGVALAEILKVAPDVSLDEFLLRAANYRTYHRDVRLTPSALCSHWAVCAKPNGNQHTPNKRPNDRHIGATDGWLDDLKKAGLG